MPTLKALPKPLPRPMVALGVMVGLLAVPYISPRLRAFRVMNAPWDPAATLDAENPPTGPAPTTAASGQLAVGETKLHSSQNEATVTNALPAAATSVVNDEPVPVAERAVEDPTGHAMDHFYARLAGTDAKAPNAVTHVLHYGDSLIAADFISGTMRRKLQSRFGDAGHGFILAANPWSWYFHNDVSHSANDGWSAQRITGPFTGDGRYGLGGVTFHGGAGAYASFGTTSKGDFGRNVSRFEIYYLEQPTGGDVEVRVKTAAGAAPIEKFSTKGPVAISRVHEVVVPDGEATMSLTSWGNGDARLFGVELERDNPGVVYSALGALGARVRLLAGLNEAHWKEQMDLADPALVVLQYGTNESEDGSFAAESYMKTLGSIVDTVKRAAPGASVLLCGPPDRAEKDDSGALTSKPIIVKLVEAQRKVAADHAVAFWDTYSAMGGAGSMGKWVHAEPQLGSWDLTHPTPAGAEVIGVRLYNAMLAGYAGWKKEGGTPFTAWRPARSAQSNPDGSAPSTATAIPDLLDAGATTPDSAADSAAPGWSGSPAHSD